MTRKAQLNAYWTRFTRERVLKRDKRCVLCLKKDQLEVHHILGRTGLSGLLCVHERLSITVCKKCHSKEKSLKKEERDEFLKNAFSKPVQKERGGGTISSSGRWEIELTVGGSYYKIVANTGHNSVCHELQELKLCEAGSRIKSKTLTVSEIKSVIEEYLG